MAIKNLWVGTAFILISNLIYSGQPITHNLAGLYDTTKVKTVLTPTFCIKNTNSGALTPWSFGQTLIPTNYSGNPYYYGGEVRMGGCDYSNSYLGWLDNNGYQPNESAHILVIQAVANLTTLSGKVDYKPIGSSDINLNQRINANWMTGFNLSGLEFSTTPNDAVIPNLSVEDAFKKDHTPNPSSDLLATRQFFVDGANTVRLPIRWAYLQPYLQFDVNGGVIKGTDTFDSHYFNFLVLTTASALTSKKYNVILDLHDYMHYSHVGTEVAGCGGPDGQCPDGKLTINPEPYVNIWSALLTQIRQDASVDEHYLMVDIINEPSNDPGDNRLSAQHVFDMEVAVIKKLESMNFQGTYLVEGVQWSGLHSWVEAGNDKVFTREAFIKAGLNESQLERIIINVHQYLDATFSGTNDACQQDLTTTGPNGFNLTTFIAYLKLNRFKAMVTEFGVGNNKSSCATPLKGFLDYMKMNAYKQGQGGFVGWTVWSTGHGWGDYNLRVKPNDWKETLIKQYYQ